MNIATNGRAAADRAVDKSTRRLIPFLLLMYVLAFLDRANVGFAKQALHDVVGISDAAFAFGASIFFIAYVLLEIPSNLAMHKVGARAWMCRIMVTWGLVSAATMFVKGPTSFYTLRFILGACEAGFFPGVILYLTYWFPDRTRAKVMGLFYFGAPLAFMFGSPLSGYLLRFDGLLGLHGYQWMFMLEGLAATAVGVWAYFYLDDKPADAGWLEADEKRELLAVLQAEQSSKISHGPHGAGSALADRTVLYFGLIFFLIQMGVSVVVFYLPTFVGKLLGTGPNALVGFVVAIPWTCALIATFAVPRWAARGNRLVFFGCASLLVAAISMFASAGASPLVSMIALCLAVAGLWAVQPIFWSMLTNYLGGMAVVSGVAMVNTIGNIGNFVSPNVKAWADASFGSSVAGLILLSGVVVLAALLFVGARRSSQPAAVKAIHT
ncbi:MFS transporter [Burkholderia ubonensis]|uniref:MFS transporter n=1 Tax=Burkholderia ubonensis TaxID=101571 RepID=UPI000755AA0C|nr:MFS transporter [Burkholderia ubonensis]KVC86442.1 MFS transporter [Burkholderia ubonensis]KVK96182.1 MFS transporter [Burkholderia ubonensis]KVQ44314.1 MFS transporter [Burkholderia ubonensis]KWK77060.1 MFS transporter [Burkholderia ubonensis]KWK92262.1 MFS transporter [Burkholderia ubonensis]